MNSIWVESLERSFSEALDMMAAAVGGCTDEVWETTMWLVPRPSDDDEFLDPNWEPVTDPAQRRVLVERWIERYSTPWSVVWHALEVLDYDLNGDFGPWEQPAPFDAHPHWRDLASLPAPWSRPQMLSYIDHCRQRVSQTLAAMSEDDAARPLPPSHRYRGQPHAWVITSLVPHTTEHAAQIHQFVAMQRMAREGQPRA